MSNRLKVGKHLLLSCSALFPVLLAGAAPAGAQAVNLGGAGNLIIPDGRTETSVSSRGATTDVRTNTVRGQTGFNSFSKFEAGSGNTVNLHLPDGTGTLVNIVRDAPVVVEGTVNALKNGSIGGNVVFSDPYGFVLGKGGVINTGGLTVNTPTKEFLDGAIDAHGRIDTAKTDRLISGDVPLSPDGSVVIRGRVNAETHIDIHAQSIDVDGEAVLKRHRENFEGSVNTAGGPAEGGALVVRNGRISLVAAGDVRIGGSVAARATGRESARAGAGRVSIKARNVTVTPTARIEALAAIAREEGADAVAARIGIEASGALDVAGTIEARGLGGAGAAVELAADRAAVKASALLSAQIEAGAGRGVVALAAKGDIALDGRIEARGADGVEGGRVDVRAGGDIAQGAASAIAADGAGEGSAGGDIRVVAARDLVVADGAEVSARGAGEADGGFAELSGHRTVALGAVDLDLRSAGAGKAGRLLIDPADIVIANASTYVRGAVGSIIDNVGSVVIEASNSITVTAAGRVDAGALDLAMRSTAIDIRTGGEVRGGGVLVETKPTGPGGVALPVGSASLVVSGRVVGGDVTLSSTDVLRIAGVVETEAAAGRTETVTIEGRDVTLGGRIEGSRVTVESRRETFVGAATLVGLASVTVGGTVSAGDVTMSALDKITLAQNGRIETRTVRLPTVATRAVSLTSREIDIQSGSAIASGTGDVTLLAEHVETVGFWEAKALAKITVAGSITGRNLTATARAVATSGPSSPTSEDPLALIGNSKVLTALGLLTGFNAGYMAADATAAVTIAGGASIDMTGDVKLAAEGTQSVSNFGRNATFGKPMAISAFVGEINAKTSVDVLDGASVRAVGDLAVSARNDALAKMKTQVRTINAPTTAADGTGANAMDIAAAVLVDDIATSAIVHGGAAISARNLSIIADNTNTFSIVSKSDAAGKSLLGMAFAIQLSNTSATARLGADYGTSLAPGGTVSVAAISNTILNLTKASAKVGGEPSELGAAIAKYGVAKLPGSAMLMGVIGKYGSWMGEIDSSFVRGSLSLALNVSEHAADASIAADAGKAAPRIVSSGNVAVVSSVYDAPIRNVSDATVAHTDEFAKEGKQLANAISAAVALVNHRSHATIGNGVSITAGNLGLSATSDTPIFVGFRTTGIDDLATPKEFLKTALNFIKVKGFVTDMIGTSFAGAQTKTEDEEVGVGASVNYLGLSNDTMAWVASDAVLRTTKASNGSVTLKDGTVTDGWAITLDTGNRVRPFTTEEQIDNAIDVLGDFFADGQVNGAPPPPVIDTNARGSDKVRTFRSGVDLQASTTTETINIAGSPAWLVLKGGTGGDDQSKSIGASGNLNFFASKTIAGIGAGASVTSAADVSVTARNRDAIYAISPSSGRGAGFGLTGLLSLVSLDNVTAASISNRASVSAHRVAIRSRQQTDILSVSGALVDGSGTSIGVAATWTTIDAATSASIADNDALVEGTEVANRAGAAAGSVTTNELLLDASSGGQIISMSVAAALSRPEDGLPGIGTKIKKTVKEYVFEPATDRLAGPLVKGANSSSKIKSLLSAKVMEGVEKLDKKLTKQPKGVSRDFSFAGAGSITGVDTQFDTQSYLDGANISRLAATGSVAVTVDATNDLLVSTTSGAASIALVGAQTANRSAAVAGAVAVSVSSNRALAAIRDSTLTDLGSTRVRAVGAGQQIVLGLGLAANTNANSSISIAGSVSLGFVFDNVDASIEGSALTAAVGTTDKDLAVKAYQTTDIGIGGLAVSVATKGKGGFGLAVTGTVIADAADPANPDNRKAVSALIHASTISNFRNLVVDAATLSRVMSGAGAVGVAPNGFGVTGSIVVNDMSDTTRAAITGGGQSVATSGNVLVRSGSKREAEIAAEISPLVANRAIQSGFDFSEQVLDSNSAGAVIFAAAGSVGVGQNSVGVSLLYNGVRHTHESLVEGVTIAAGGDVSVLSADDTKLIGVAAGVSVATGQFGGAGSIVVQVVANKTAATVRGASTSISARAISVGAANASHIVAGAGAVGVSTQAAGLGLSLANATVANDTDALVERATLTARGDVDLRATSQGDILTFAVSVGAGGSVGIAGSIATSVALNDARARIVGASVTADDNVLVAAENTDGVNAVAGAIGVGLRAAGVGLSTVVNVVRGETIAAVESFADADPSTADVASTIVARGRGAAASVDDGIVGTAYSYTDPGSIANALVALTPNTANGRRGVSGLSVGAVSRQTVGSFSLAAAVGINAETLVSVAGAVSPVVNVLGGKTEATIAGARINAAGADNEAADILVIASSNTFVQNAVLAAAGSTGAAGAAGFVSNVMERTTNATVRDAAIGANGSVGAIDVRAAGIMDSVNLVAGLSVGPVGVAGSMVVNVFDADTLAEVSGGTIRAGSLGVVAKADTGFLGTAASVAAGSTAVGGAMNVAVNLGSTKALAGKASADTTLVLSGDLSVAARSRDEHRTFVVGGALSAGGGSAVAGMLNLSVLMSDTIASVNRLTASSMRNVSVEATNVVDLKPVTGGFGVSLDSVGVGAAANIMLVKATVSAEVLNSRFTARGTLDVAAHGERRNQMVTATLGAGGTAGIGASIGVFVAGSGMSDDAGKEFGRTLTAADDQADQSLGGSFGGSGTEPYRTTSAQAGAGPATAGDPDALTRDDLVSGAVGSSRRDSVTATIAGGTITAGATNVLAESRLETLNLSYGIGLGAGAGVGAALGFTFVDQSVAAAVSADLTVASLAVKARSGQFGSAPAVAVRSRAGAGGLVGALGAAVAVAKVDSDTYAGIGGTVTTTGRVLVEADDTLAVESEAIGATASGGIALGISLALAHRDGDVTAETLGSAVVRNASDVEISAEAEGSTKARAIAGAGGLLGAGVGASGTAKETSRVLAGIGTGGTFTAIKAGGIRLAARATPTIRAESDGYAVAGTGAVGASVAVALSDMTVRAIVGNAVNAGTTGLFSVKADLSSNGGDTAYARAVAGAGALTFSAQASAATAKTTGRLEASIGDDGEIGTNDRDIEVKARSRTRQTADVTGVAASGGLAVGATVAAAVSDVRTAAKVGDRATIAGRNLTIDADGADENVAIAVSGAGALIAGQVAVVTTKTDSQTTASLGRGSALDAIALKGTLTVAAQHLGTIGGSVSSVNAALVGASGAAAVHKVGSIVKATVGEGAFATAAHLDVTAVNRTHRLFSNETGVDLRTRTARSDENADWTLNSGSGGVLNAAAGDSGMEIAHTTQATLGADARVRLVAAGSTVSEANILAYNEMIVHEKAKLDSGGLVALARTKVGLTVSRNEATVRIGDRASLVLPNGRIRAAAFDNAHLDIKAASTTYGVAGAPQGDAEIDYRRANLVDVGAHARLEANTADSLQAGTIRLSSGADLDAKASTVTANATVDLFNKTAIPIPSIPDPIVRVSGRSDVAIAASTLPTDGSDPQEGVRAAGSVYLTATRGVVAAKATGTGKDIYREAAAQLANAVIELFDGKPVSFDYKGGDTDVSGLGIVTVEGSVLTGISRNRSVVVDYARENVGTCLVATTICLAAPVDGAIGYDVSADVEIGTTIVERLAELRRLLSDYGSDPVASLAYRSEVDFLEKKLIGLGLSKDGSSGSYSKPSQLAEKQQELALNRQLLNAIGGTFDSAASGIASGTGSVPDAASDIASGASTIGTSVSGAKAAARAILDAADDLSQYGGGNAGANAADVARIGSLLDANDTLADDIAAARSSLSTARQAIVDARAAIADQQAVIRDKTAAMQARGASAAEIARLQAEVETARGTIATATATLSSNLDALQTATATIKTKSDTAKANIETIDTLQAGIVTRSKGSDSTAAIDLQAARLRTAGTNAATAAGTIGTKTGTVDTSRSGTRTAVAAIGSYAADRTTAATSVSTIEAGIANGLYSATNSDAPKTKTLTIRDTVARLGDVVVVADRLVGGGTLSAPGDATISIVNNTAYTLQLGNLTVDSESGGRILLNGVAVETRAKIQALNESGTAAGFAQLVTAVSGGKPLPSLSITSNYSLDDTAFYDASSPKLYLKTPNPAPDIVLLEGKTLSNVRGRLSITSEAGNIYMRGETDVGQASIVAKNGDFVQSYVYGFQHVAGDPANGVPLGRGITANGAVNVSARYLNVNGVIQSGIANWALTIPNAPKVLMSAADAGQASRVAGYLADFRTRSATDPALSPVREIVAGSLWFDASGDDGAGQFYATTDYARTRFSTGRFKLKDTVGNIGASFDVAADRFEVDGTNVRGGSIQLVGQILSTGGGSLNVLDGYGQIDIANNDGRAVVLAKLDTGEDPTGTGRGIAGRIEIMDVYAVKPNGARAGTAVKTVYERLDGVVKSVRQEGYFTADGIFVCGTDCTTGTGTGTARTASYAPQDGLRYNTTTGQDSSTKKVTHYRGTQFFGNADWRTDPDLEVLSEVETQLSSYRLADGTYVSLGTAVGSRTEPSPTTAQKTTTLVDDWSSCNWWTLCIAADYNFIIEEVTPSKTITTNTLKADHAIAVNFVGSDTGSISVRSTGDVFLAGTVNNRTGDTRIVTDGSIRNGDKPAIVNSRSIALEADGTVGELGKAIAISMTGGALDAFAGDGNVVLSANTAVAVGRIKAVGSVSALKGRVVLDAAQSITAASGAIPSDPGTPGIVPGARIEAPRVELASRFGSIGSTADLLPVNTGFTTASADRPFGDPEKGAVLNTYYGLKAQASGAIGIEAKAWSGNAAANILVDRVVSTGGDVTLKTAGAILDNNPIQSIDTRTYDELLAYWTSLNLLDDTKTIAVVRAFETQAATDKRLFDQLVARSGGAGYDAAHPYRMTAAEKAGFEAALTAADDTLTPAEVAARVAAYETTQTDRYGQIQATLASLTGTFDAAGAYTASAAETAARRSGSTWTDRQLAFSLSPGALKTITGTNPVSKASNVSGRIVTLNAGQGLGEVAGTIEIDTAIAPRAMSDAQKIALATAERSDFLSGGPSDRIRIQSIRMLNFDAATRLDAALDMGSTAQAYLATAGTARLGAISVPGELRVKARGSIVNAGGSVTAGAYVLEASGGEIGIAAGPGRIAAPLIIRPVATTGSVAAGYKGSVIARASGAIDLAVQGADGRGDANVDTVYSRKGVRIAASRSIRNANGDALINVLGDTVDLAANGGSIGESGNRLNVGNGLAGHLDATAAGAIHLFAPDGQHLTLRTLTAGGGGVDVVAGDLLSPASQADLTLSGTLSAATSVDLRATGRLAALRTSSVEALGGDLIAQAGAIRMLTGAGFQATGRIALTATGDALVTGLTAGSTARDAVRVTAGGRILAGTAANRTDIETTAPGGGIVLAAATGIGASRVANDSLEDASETAVLNPLRLRTERADLRTTSGTLSARFLGDVDAVVRNAGGSIDLDADGAFASALVGADGGTVRIDAAGSLSIAALSARSAALAAGGALGIGTGRLSGAATFASRGSMDVADLDAGSATLDAGGALAGGRLTVAGDAILRSAGAVRLREATVGGTFAANALGDIEMERLAAGAASLEAGGSISVLDTVADTSVSADAAGALTMRRVVSGGTQRLSATGDLVFDHLRTLGIASDPGDIHLTSRGGSVLGGEVFAARDLFIDAKNALVFSRLTSVRDMSLTVGGSLTGPDLEAGGELAFDVAGDQPIRLKTMRGKTLKMSGRGPLAIDDAYVSEGAVLEAPSITIGRLTYTGAEQLLLTLRGYRGAVADFAGMTIAAPNGIEIGQLRVADSRFVTDAMNVRLIDGYVPGSFGLVTPSRTVWMDNRTPRPVLGNDIQLYRPDFAFGLDQSANRTTTTSYVVRYGAGTDARTIWNGDVYPGASFVRDFERAMQDASNDRASPVSQRSLTRMTIDSVMALFRRALAGSVSAPLDGPAVRTSEEAEGEREEAAVR